MSDQNKQKEEVKKILTELSEEGVSLLKEYKAGMKKYEIDLLKALATSLEDR